MKTLRGFLVTALLVASATGCFEKQNTVTGPGPTGPPDSKLLSVPFFGQQTLEWCWAAAIEMVTTYYGRPVHQCQTLSVFLGGDCCNFPEFCVVGAPSMQTIQQGLYSLAGLQSQYVPSPITFEAVKAEIAAGRPIIIGYQGSSGGHVVVINGYDRNGNISILDPFFGPQGAVPYGASFVYQGGKTWVASIVGIQ